MNKRDVFLALIGPQAYNLLKSLIAPVKPSNKAYADLVVETLMQHNEPAPSETVRQYHFNTTVCHKDESVATYVSQLQGLAQFCNFGTNVQGSSGLRYQ